MKTSDYCYECKHFTYGMFAEGYCTKTQSQVDAYTPVCFRFKDKKEQ